MSIKSIGSDARRYLINAQEIFQQFQEVERELADLQGSMRWKKSGGHEYLYHQRLANGNGKSLGRRSEESEQVKERFDERKGGLKSRRKSLLDSLNEVGRYCIAGGVNRVPKEQARLLRGLNKKGLLGEALVVAGSNALYAYETAAGVIFDQELVSTFDIDLLFEHRAKLLLRSTQLKKEGLIAVLKTIDSSYEVIPKGNFRATNKKGFIVDLIKGMPTSRMDVEPVSVSNNEDDLYASEVEGLEWLINSPTIESIAIAHDGLPVRIVAPDPRCFALHKLFVSHKEDRSPLKRSKDYKQALDVAWAAEKFLNLKFESDTLKMFPLAIRERFLPEIAAHIGKQMDDEMHDPFV